MSFHFPDRLNFKSETRFAVAVRGGPQWNIPKLFIRISFICSLSAWNPGRLRDDETPGQSSIINDKTRPKMRILYSVSFYLFPLSVRFLYSWVTLISAPKKNEGKEKVSEIISCTLRKFYLAGYRYSLSRNRWRRRRISHRQEPRKSSKMAVLLKFLRILIPLSFFGPVLRSSLSFFVYLVPRFYGVLVFEVLAFLCSSRSLFHRSFYRNVFLLFKRKF